jgi:hypothetical protein
MKFAEIVTLLSAGPLAAVLLTVEPEAEAPKPPPAIVQPVVAAEPIVEIVVTAPRPQKSASSQSRLML